VIPARAEKYADKYGANPDLWWFLTGPKKKIYDFAIRIEAWYFRWGRG
jgi:protein SCO1/2